MLTYEAGSIWDTDAEVIVIPVNCVGVMGAGMARQLKEDFPEVFLNYEQSCLYGLFSPGGALYFEGDDGDAFILAATKDDWRDPSRLEWIEQLVSEEIPGAMADFGLFDVALPKLGCGKGGLNWESQVQPLYEKYLQNNEQLLAKVY